MRRAVRCLAIPVVVIEWWLSRGIIENEPPVTLWQAIKEWVR